MFQPLNEGLAGEEQQELKIVETVSLRAPPKKRRKKRRDLWSRRSRPRKQKTRQMEPLQAYIDPPLMTSQFQDFCYGDDNWMCNDDRWKQPTAAEDEYFHQEASLPRLTSTITQPPRGSHDCFLTEGLSPEPSEPFPDVELSHFAYEPWQPGNGIWSDEAESLKPEMVEDQLDVELLTPDIKVEPIEEDSFNDQLVIKEEDNERNTVYLTDPLGLGTVSIDPIPSSLTTKAAAATSTSAKNYLSVATTQFQFSSSSNSLAIPPMSMALRPRRVVHVTCSVPMRQTVRRASVSTVFLRKGLHSTGAVDAAKAAVQPKRKTYWVSESSMYNSVKHIARRNRQKMVCPGMASTLEKRKSPDHNLRERERRCFIQTKFQDLREVLGLKATASKINVLKEAKLECSALQIMSNNLEQIMKETFLKKERLIAELDKLMKLKQEKECFTQSHKN